MATVTISSGVHVGTRYDNAAFIDWFAASPTTQFSSFSFTSAGSVPSARTGPQQISGHASLTDLPIEFSVERRARDVLTDSLAAVAVKDLLNGRPRTTLSGFKDAMARSGYLVKVGWSERDNVSGSTNAYEVWGVLQVPDATVRGARESLRLVLWPCDALGWIGTTSWFLTPTEYAALST